MAKLECSQLHDHRHARFFRRIVWTRGFRALRSFCCLRLVDLLLYIFVQFIVLGILSCWLQQTNFDRRCPLKGEREMKGRMTNLPLVCNACCYFHHYLREEERRSFFTSIAYLFVEGNRRHLDQPCLGTHVCVCVRTRGCDENRLPCVAQVVPLPAIYSTRLKRLHMYVDADAAGRPITDFQKDLCDGRRLGLGSHATNKGGVEGWK
jgi:hypothetical protein